MALKFLNKKGWHTGSLRNIENVWKAEQKHEAEQKKLEEFKKQIEEERERFEFRLLQEQAGLVPKQERLEFLYDSGLAVGKGSSEGFKALETPKLETEREVPKSQASVVGALFEDKPQSANDAWRKLHSDPLLMIRQREQEALARIKNNPIRMELIRKSVAEGKKEHKENHKEKRNRKEHKEKHHKKTKRKKQAWSDSKSASSSEGERREREHPVHRTRPASSLEEERDRKHPEGRPPRRPAELRRREERQHLEGRPLCPDSGHVSGNHHTRTDAPTFKHVPPNKDRTDLRLSAEEKAARFREMQLDAELHEEQRWRRLKKASEADAREVNRESASSSRNFLDAAQKSVFGTEKGGSSSIEESVRRRAHYRQGRSEARDGNAFRR